MVDIRLDRRLQARVDASDVVQEAYLEVVQRLDEYVADPKLPLFLWLRLVVGQRLMKVHRQHLGTQLRDAGREVSLYRDAMPAASSAALAAQLLGKYTSPTQAAGRAERMLRLQEALNTLDPVDREVLSLRHFEELTRAEAAQVLGISEAAAVKRYRPGAEAVDESARRHARWVGGAPTMTSAYAEKHDLVDQVAEFQAHPAVRRRFGRHNSWPARVLDRVTLSTACILAAILAARPTPAFAQIYNWQTGQVIPGTQGITPGPGVDLSGWNSAGHQLEYVNLSAVYLTGASFANSDLSYARFSPGSVLTNANFSGAIVTGATFAGATLRGFTPSQLYGTASYVNANLSGIELVGNDLTGWNFVGQNLSGADFGGNPFASDTPPAASLTGANFRNANLTGANFASFSPNDGSLPERCFHRRRRSGSQFRRHRPDPYPDIQHGELCHR